MTCIYACMNNLCCAMVSSLIGCYGPRTACFDVWSIVYIDVRILKLELGFLNSKWIRGKYTVIWTANDSKNCLSVLYLRIWTPSHLCLEAVCMCWSHIIYVINFPYYYCWFPWSIIDWVKFLKVRGDKILHGWLTVLWQ